MEDTGVSPVIGTTAHERTHYKTIDKMKQEQSRRIQTSVLNAAEKKVLVWLAQRQPRWVTSDGLTAIGVAGAIIVALGYILSNHHIGWLWLASLGFVINWYGDSLDGTLARVRGEDSSAASSPASQPSSAASSPSPATTSGCGG